MKSAKKFQYQKRDVGTVKTRANQQGGDFDSLYKDGIKIFKPKEGKNTIRVLPPTWEGADHYGYDVYVNYGIGVKDQAYLSLSEMKKKPDPLAEARRRADREGDKETSDSLRPTKRVGMFVIDRTAEEEGPQFWIAPWTIDKSFCNLSLDEEDGTPMYIDDPEAGNDVRFYKEGTGKTTKYPADKMRILKPSRLSEDAELAEEWLQYVMENPIPDCLNFYDYDHIKAAYDGFSKDDEKADDSPKSSKLKAVKNDDDDEDENPLPKSSAKVSSVRNKLEKPPQDDDDEEVDEETGEVAVKGPGDEEPEPTSRIAAIKARLQGRRA